MCACTHTPFVLNFAAFILMKNDACRPKSLWLCWSGDGSPMAEILVVVEALSVECLLPELALASQGRTMFLPLHGG